MGGLALQDPTVESDLQAIVQAIRILSSPDEVVANIVKQELKMFVRRKAQSTPTAELVTKYLSASQDLIVVSRSNGLSTAKGHICLL